MTQEERPIVYTILPDTSISINYSKTQKSHLKYEIKYDLN